MELSTVWKLIALKFHVRAVPSATRRHQPRLRPSRRRSVRQESPRQVRLPFQQQAPAVRLRPNPPRVNRHWLPRRPLQYPWHRRIAV